MSESYHSLTDSSDNPETQKPSPQSNRTLRRSSWWPYRCNLLSVDLLLAAYLQLDDIHLCGSQLHLAVLPVLAGLVVCLDRSVSVVNSTTQRLPPLTFASWSMRQSISLRWLIRFSFSFSNNRTVWGVISPPKSTCKEFDRTDFWTVVSAVE